MPLHDHFRPPLSDRRSWEGFFGRRPMMIVDALGRKLPECFIVEPLVYLDSAIEIEYPFTVRIPEVGVGAATQVPVHEPRVTGGQDSTEPRAYYEGPSVDHTEARYRTTKLDNWPGRLEAPRDCITVQDESLAAPDQIVAVEAGDIPGQIEAAGGRVRLR